MGLNMTNYYLENGLFSPMVFIQVEYISGNAEAMTADVRFYVSEEAANDGLPFIEQKAYNFIPDLSEGSSNYHTQAYNYLKNLDEFVNAVDA